MLIYYIFTAIVVAFLGYFIINNVSFDIKYKRDEIKQDKEILSMSSSLYGPKYSFEYKYKWNIFKPNENNLYVYKGDEENKKLLVVIPTYHIRLLKYDLKEIIDQKERYYLKPVHEKVVEVSKNSISEEIAGCCLDVSFYPKKIDEEETKTINKILNFYATLIRCTAIIFSIYYFSRNIIISIFDKDNSIPGEVNITNTSDSMKRCRRCQKSKKRRGGMRYEKRIKKGYKRKIKRCSYKHG
ncbi:hypothetical protein NE686_17495 [Tissierella carlieri]|uniref:DUF3592 domain-containing protein n=1 Tax=Tissierella carlieri TaxID=689904 RepID=A0ABT1SF44_9FIRM|nr:hypothetical protein [Tissierella carlieri]MCQ4924900.1 hypothetical protein [Tissierella carlieri]